ncbi:hypothetical protein [Demequina litorisediminis]|uniref:Uncharacterized protein n=1 Tax=Demequina litorisediminis TaxID=1849022 RepID=A0ABQ6I9S3_9MICO|nr:hypothetical protein [Demequina litorisediminis]GMA34555.1 hypothetical protein GCM10025876_07590 [Demequina litorisediminis]
MITLSVPSQAVADAVGDLGEDVRLIVWNPADGDAPAGAEQIQAGVLGSPHRGPDRVLPAG